MSLLSFQFQVFIGLWGPPLLRLTRLLHYSLLQLLGGKKVILLSSFSLINLALSVPLVLSFVSTFLGFRVYLFQPCDCLLYCLLWTISEYVVCGCECLSFNIFYVESYSKDGSTTHSTPPTQLFVFLSISGPCSHKMMSPSVLLTSSSRMQGK